MGYILSMDVGNGIAFIQKAFEKELEERMWSRYLVDYQHMTEESFLTFDEYRDMLNVKPKTKKTLKQEKKEIETRVDQIINLTLAKGGK